MDLRDNFPHEQALEVTQTLIIFLLSPNSHAEDQGQDHSETWPLVVEAQTMFMTW